MKRVGKPSTGPICWTIARASAEFGLDDHTLSDRLTRAGIKPGEDGFYTTKQIASAIYGDLEFERIRKTKEEADQIQMENEVSRGNLIPADQVKSRWVSIATRIRTIIEGSAMPEELKSNIFEALVESR